MNSPMDASSLRANPSQLARSVHTRSDFRLGRDFMEQKTANRSWIKAVGCETFLQSLEQSLRSIPRCIARSSPPPAAARKCHSLLLA